MTSLITGYNYTSTTTGYVQDISNIFLPLNGGTPGPDTSFNINIDGIVNDLSAFFAPYISGTQQAPTTNIKSNNVDLCEIFQYILYPPQFTYTISNMIDVSSNYTPSSISGLAYNQLEIFLTTQSTTGSCDISFSSVITDMSCIVIGGGGCGGESKTNTANSRKIQLAVQPLEPDNEQVISSHANLVKALQSYAQEDEDEGKPIERDEIIKDPYVQEREFLNLYEGDETNSTQPKETGQSSVSGKERYEGVAKSTEKLASVLGTDSPIRKKVATDYLSPAPVAKDVRFSTLINYRRMKMT